MGLKKTVKKAKKKATKNSNIVSVYANAANKVVNSKYAPKAAQKLSPVLSKVSDSANQFSMNYIKQYAGSAISEQVANSEYASTIEDARNEYNNIKAVQADVKNQLPLVSRIPVSKNPTVSTAPKYQTTEYEATKTGLQPVVKSGVSTVKADQKKDNTMMYIAGVGALAVVAFFAMSGNKKKR